MPCNDNMLQHNTIMTYGQRPLAIQDALTHNNQMCKTTVPALHSQSVQPLLTLDITSDCLISHPCINILNGYLLVNLAFTPVTGV